MKLTKKDIGKYYLLFDMEYNDYFIGRLYNIRNSHMCPYIIYVLSLDDVRGFTQSEIIKELKDSELVLELI